jgi:hypothetical protein
MAHYYLYLLDVHGHIKAREILTTDSDADAVGRSENYLRQHESIPAVELWLGERRVTRIKQTEALGKD